MAKETKPLSRPDRAEAEEAVRTLIRWAGENPAREGLLETPRRVVKAWQEHFSGYEQDAGKLLERTFADGMDKYSEAVVLTDIDFYSHCEHHLEPIIGSISVGYLPAKKIVGLSKLVRVCKMYSQRMQTQEALTIQIAEALQQYLTPRGVAVWISARHHCMISRGIRSPRTNTETSHFVGEYDEPAHKVAFLQACRDAQQRNA